MIDRRRLFDYPALAPALGLAGLALLGCPPPEPPGPTGGFPEPELVVSRDGSLEIDLYVQFAKARITGAVDSTTGEPVREIWTRAYATEPADPQDPHDEIPGPTLAYHPGEWLQITLHNQLNRSANPWLDDFQNNIPADSEDDIEEHIPSELNIPHNANNTNLHVHGMHVDPKDDNVTLVILPEDDDPSNYTPQLQRLIPNIDRWWEWEYGYRIPADHLPGTHWYHAHKHGATSTHVENGMAGTLLIRPNDPADDIVPGLWSDDPGRTHDRVMVIQEIANYGVQQGAGDSLQVSAQASATDQYTTDWPDITVNGEHQPTLELAPGQTERWRFIDAGANHRNASYLWVGGLVLPEAETIPPELRSELEAITDFETAKPYIQLGGPGTKNFSDQFEIGIVPFPGKVVLAAIDGVTLHQGVEVTEISPVLLGPGNRADLFVQADADASGKYYVSKNFDVAPPLAVMAGKYPDLFGGEAGYWRYEALTTANGGTDVQNGTGTPFGDDFNPYNGFSNLSGDPYALGTDFTKFQSEWPCQVDVKGDIVLADAKKEQQPCGNQHSNESTQQTSLAPLIYGQADGAGVAAASIGPGFQFPGLGWMPTKAGGGVIDAQVLFTVEISGPAVSGRPSLPTDERLNRLSPTTTDPANTLLETLDAQGQLVPGIPSYVAPITDADLAGRQVIVFDKSGINFLYEQPQPATGTTKIHQFSLNGRQFDLDDFVGNPGADRLIREPVPAAIPSFYKQGVNIGTYAYNGAGNYSNQVQVGGVPAAFFTNPGYFVPVVQQTLGDGSPYYTFDNQKAPTPPSYTAVTGLAAPRQPESTTAEEWLLVNNSRIFHPFHIHISPFLVKEVGQLSYSEDGGWGFKTLQPDDPLGYVLDNWWDVIIIPPHGYVKMRTWLNMPDQKPRNPADPNSDFVITENANVFGSWVYHCHILRHEDRGMMMVVSVKPKPAA